MIHLREVTNPIEPSVGRRDSEIPHADDCRLTQVVRGYLTTSGNPGAEMTVSVNGHIIPAGQHAELVLNDGDYVILSPSVAGGSLIRTLASVAVLAVAAIATYGASLTVAGSTLAFGGLGLGAATSSLVAGAITIAGNLLVGALLGPSAPSSKAPSPTYDPDGPTSLARSGTVIPKGHGKMRWGGNKIAGFTDIDGEDQYITGLWSFGFGPARAIANIEINDKPINDYANVQTFIRYGTNDQLPIPNFNRIVNGYPQDVRLLAGQPVVVPGTGTLTQELQVDLSFPDGIWVLTSLSNLIPGVISYLIEVAPSGTQNWISPTFPYATQDFITYNADGTVASAPTWCVVATDAPPNNGIVYAIDNGPHSPGDPYTGTIPCEQFQPNGNHTQVDWPVRGEWQPVNPALDQALVTMLRQGYQNFTACDRSPLYVRCNIPGLAAGKWDTRVTKYGFARLHDDIDFGDNLSPNVGQEIYIHSVNEVALLDLAYPNMILLGIRALATNQLSGQGINVTAEITHGLRTLDNNVLPGVLQAYEEDNPACVAADMLLDDLYGGGEWPGIKAQNITRFIGEWQAWADLADELVDDGNGGSIRRSPFRGVFDDEDNLWNQAAKVARMSRAAIIPMGLDYGVFVDQPDVPVQMFTMGNILDDSYSDTWLQIDERANQVEIQFADETREYKADNPIAYMDPAQQDAGVVIKNTRIDGRGVVVPAQAWHLARYKQRSNEFLLQSGSFKCDTDAIACRAGNLIILQHDVPQFGWGGRVLAGNTASVLKLDRNDLVLAPGTSYSAIVLHPALLRYTGTITGVSPWTDLKTNALLGIGLQLSNFDNVQRVTRMVVGEHDSVISQSLPGKIMIQAAPGYMPAIGDPYTLYDTDVMEARPILSVSAPGGASQVLTLAAPLSLAPIDFATYYADATGSQKIVRVLSIKKASDFRSSIDWIDYEPDLYIDGTPVIGETSAQTTTNPGVTALTGSETIVQVGGSNVGYAYLAWKLGPDTAGVGVYATLIGAASNPATGNLAAGNPALPKLIARLTGSAVSYQDQIDPGQAWKYTVVGFDANDVYASFASAPSVTVAAVGQTTNLLLGSNFASGFTYWNLTARPGDTLVSTYADDGQCLYTVLGIALTVAQTLLYQVVPSSKWSIGQPLMLSAYLEDACAAAAAPNVGNLVATLSFIDSGNMVISSVTASVAMSGIAPNLTRVFTPSTVIPAGTVSVVVSLGVAANSAGALNIPVGSVLTFSHVLLEISTATQTAPSAWADIDAYGQILDFFTGGSSTGLRTQGSLLPSFTGAFSTTLTDTTATIAWKNLAILWPDGSYTYVTDGSRTWTGLTAATGYWAFPYFDIILGGMQFATPAISQGSPNGLAGGYDPQADAYCRQDNHVPFAPGGMIITTQAAGTTTGTTGTTGGNNGGTPSSPTKPPPDPTYPPGYNGPRGF